MPQEWIAYAQTKTARHKLAKFLKDHADLVDPALSPDVTCVEASGMQEASAPSRQEAESQVRSCSSQFLREHCPLSVR